MNEADMKAELSLQGYEFWENDYGDSVYWYNVSTPNDWVLEDISEQFVIQKAYEHLQHQRELESLRADNKNLRAYIDKYNITDDGNNKDDS